ncbi:hypothetical protein HER10_EVM0006922 [Colletotrichum scovillei]|uniref:Uncharacterized protein n=1 Tax=Colletotrichum scovillei TaxID=1209932 RepID=A0A9P7QSG4_9PEZI|nr:uncharacterized protein HER10_EVM0006922 [Colletotrichum scovillei]KAF4778557.1 hypothetical protein HER10_EVM0006922 [Colletotrichum scovillei]KAG7039873.1 hypothetical protein JMJ78_0011533 [Colletotrichum scovillei]KAG7042049.1 hypothetical protein JMJ77_0010155 [Colletotrichum scovillei]KAG7062080.1 hypothetical protein JMJ76_0006362 [Colletotrichum scovillei]
MAPSIASIKALLALTEHSNFDVHFSITTPYGLTLKLSGDSLQVRLAEDKDPLSDTPTALAESQLPVTQALSEPLSKVEEENSVHEPPTDTPLLQIHKEGPSESEDQLESESQLNERPEPQEEHGSSLPGYKYSIWPDYGTNFMWYTYGWPANPEGGDNIDDDDLKERYPEAWFNAYTDWWKQYTEAFIAQGLDQGYDNPLFQTAEKENVWKMEGALLAAWLALQDGVHAVNYAPENVDRYRFDFERDSIEKTLGNFLQSIKLDQRPLEAAAGP